MHIFNDGRIYENLPLYHVNTVWIFNSILMSKLENIEDVNLVNLDMWGLITPELIKGWKKIKTLNMSFNRLEGEIPDIAEWELWTDMKYLELNNNNFTGLLPL